MRTLKPALKLVYRVPISKTPKAIALMEIKNALMDLKKGVLNF